MVVRSIRGDENRELFAHSEAACFKLNERQEAGEDAGKMVRERWEKRGLIRDEPSMAR